MCKGHVQCINSWNPVNDGPNFRCNKIDTSKPSFHPRKENSNET